jgi:hypothetical protein
LQRRKSETRPSREQMDQSREIYQRTSFCLHQFARGRLERLDIRIRVGRTGLGIRVAQMKPLTNGHEAEIDKAVRAR